VPPSREFTEEEKKLFAERAQRDPTGLTARMGCRVTHMQGQTPGEVSLAWQTRPDYYFDPDQLYDLEADPAELKNLARDPKCLAVLKDMKAKLREYCLKLPGTFAEFKTLEDCPPEFRELLDRARKEPLLPIKTTRKLSDKTPKPKQKNKE
jgi:hypothetical protein